MEFLFLQDNIEIFTTEQGIVCNPVPHNNGFILPLGWDQELQNRNISFEVITYTPIQKEEI